MTRIVLDRVSLEYPVLGGSLGNLLTPQKKLKQTLGGQKKKDGSVIALQDISISVDEGDRIALVGSNGSGKTTLLKVVAGIYEPTTGHIEVRGRRMAVFGLGVGTNLEATGLRNIVIRGLMAGFSHVEIDEKIPEIAAFSELGDFLNMPVRTYSQGMAMRLAFATTTAFQPDILILDEWLGAGDEAFRQKAAERMNRFVSSAGCLWFASHNHNLLRQTCNKCIWLDRGIVRAFGNTEAVLESYRSVKAA